MAVSTPAGFTTIVTPPALRLQLHTHTHIYIIVKSIHSSLNLELKIIGNI